MTAQKLKLWENSKFQNVTNKKIKIVTKLRIENVTTPKLKLWQNPIHEKTQNLEVWPNTKKIKLWQNSKPKFWQNSKTQILQTNLLTNFKQYFGKNDLKPWHQMRCTLGSRLQSCNVHTFLFVGNFSQHHRFRWDQ